VAAKVVALQQDGMRAFLMFDFVTPDRISLNGVPCVMNRVMPSAAATASVTGSSTSGTGEAASLSLAAALAGPGSVRPVAGGEFFARSQAEREHRARPGRRRSGARRAPPLRAWGQHASRSNLRVATEWQR
jgi:hypothetical protein